MSQQQVTARIPVPSKFEASVPNLEVAWRKFERVWTNYEAASRLDTQSVEYRAAVFKSCLGDAALDILEGLPFEDEDGKKNINEILKLFKEYCVGETCEVFETYKFHQRRQDKGESIDSYVAVLRQLASSCNFGTFEERAIRDQMVAGIADDVVRQKLLQQKALTLKTCIELCRVHETSVQQAKKMAGDDMQSINAVRSRKGAKTKGAAAAAARGANAGVRSVCLYCGKSHQKGKEHCPAFGKECRKCGKRNHYAKNCRGKKARRPVHAVCESDDESYEDENVLCVNDDVVLRVTDDDRYREKSVHANMLVGHNKVNVTFQLDSGATINSFSVDTYKAVTRDTTLTQLQTCDKRLLLYDKTVVTPVGERILSVLNPKTDKRYRVRFVVVEGSVRPILGCRAVQHMNLLTVNHENIAVISGPTILSEYKDVFEGELGALEGELHLVTDPTVPPVKLPCRQWPIAVREKVKAELDRLLGLGVISRVDTPTDWISSVVVTMKPNGQARLCVDPKPLNRALKRNEYLMKTIDDAIEELQGAKWFSHFDLKNGFWHVVLDEESSFLTTFETPFGKFRWNRMPFGASVCPEEFQRRVDEALHGLPGVVAVHDDVIVWGKGDTDEAASKDHDQNVRLFLQRCRQKNIKLNKEKVELHKREISYLGHVISEEGLKVDQKKVDAIQSFPVPEDKAAVQRLLGMVGYLQKFAPRLSEVAAPLRELCKKGMHFRWDPDVHGEAFREIKRMLSEAPVLRFFDKNAKTTLQCDASEFGLGACLLSDGQPVHFASRALTETERNYAQIEKEMLAIVFALERFERYVYGRNVEIETDHKPLIPIHSKSLLSAPKRLQRMLLRTQKFEYNVEYKKGTEMYLADTLSRAVQPGSRGKGRADKERIFQTELEQEVETINMAAHVSVSDQRLEELQKATKQDPDLCQLMQVTQRGWPESRKELTANLQVYFPFREEISTQNGLCFKGERIIIPTAKREKILNLLHQAHTGIQGCMRRAREVVYWPGLNADLENLVATCEPCQMFQRDQPKEPMISHQIPTRPWEMVGCDLMDFRDKAYLVLVDYYSDFFEIDRLETKTAEEVIRKLKAHLARHGIPDRMISDNGPPFNSQKFKEFAQTWEFEHITSSPYYPQSNGKAENAVKQAKTLLKKTVENQSDPFLALLELRNIPSETLNTSPSQRLFSRRTRTRIPTAKLLLKPKTCENVSEKLHSRKEKQAKQYNRGSTELDTLKPGQSVRVRMGQKWVKATVEQQVDVRSYKLYTEEGREYRRNRRHIRIGQEPSKTTSITAPEKTKHRQCDLERLERANDQAVENYRKTERNQANSQTSERPNESHSYKTTEQTETKQKSRSQVKVTDPVTPTNAQQTDSDSGQTQTRVTSRGRPVKTPSYLRDYTT